MSVSEIQEAWGELESTLHKEATAEEKPGGAATEQALETPEALETLVDQETLVVLDESEVEPEALAAPETAESEVVPETQRKPLPDVPLREMPTAPASLEQVHRHYYAQSMVYALKRNGVEVRDDGGDLAEKEREAYDRDPKGFMDIRDWARENARVQAEHYRQEAIEPYRARTQENAVIGFLNRFQRECPDVVDVLEDMKGLQGKLFERWPELAEEPRLAIPILYQQAKERRIRSTSTQAPRVAPKVESGGARASKTTTVRRDPLKLLEPARAPGNLAKLLDLI